MSLQYYSVELTKDKNENFTTKAVPENTGFWARRHQVEIMRYEYEQELLALRKQLPRDTDITENKHGLHTCNCCKRDVVDEGDKYCPNCGSKLVWRY